MWLVWPGEMISVIVVSSIYLWVKHDSFSLSIKMMNVRGPSHDPWGMPPFKLSHEERLLAILTRCCRFVRKDANQLITEPGIASASRLLMTTVLSTRSKALEKSTNVTLATWDWSRALCHMCSISTRAWVVDRPLMAQNCLVSNLLTTRSKIQLPTWLNILDKVQGVKEIGRRSDSIVLGGWTLGTGITLARFHDVGKIPLLWEYSWIKTWMPVFWRSYSEAFSWK